MKDILIALFGIAAMVLAAPWLFRLVDTAEPYLRRYFEWVMR